ncbi:ArgR family transcriptional regulator [Acidipila sp. EB88]|nr:ArgR family transcriptional regulator [Acidipila sp. EB88]
MQWALPRLNQPQQRGSAKRVTASENKAERHTAIRDVLHASAIASQDELRRKLARRGFRVTQATLSRDIRELHLMKGPSGYALPGQGNNGVADEENEDRLPALGDLLDSFGLRIEQAQNLLVVITVMGSAQPVAAALDYAGLPEVVGTVAGDNTVLIICPDRKQAKALCTRLRILIG